MRDHMHDGAGNGRTEATAEESWRDLLDAAPPWVRKLVDMAAGAGLEPEAVWEAQRSRPSSEARGDGAAREDVGAPFGSGFGPALLKALTGTATPWGGTTTRASRGDVRNAILGLLAEAPMHGYQLMQEVSRRSGGAWRPSPGSVYPTLTQMEEEGLVEGTADGGRRVFRLTDAGRDAAATADAHADKAPWDSVGEKVDEGVAALRRESGALTTAVTAVASTGGPEQVAAAAEIMADARRALYRLLAEA